MTRWKVLGLGLPVWTLLMVGVWLVVPWVFYAPPCVPRTIGGGLSPACAAVLSAGSMALFYAQVVPVVGLWLGGYALVGSWAVRSTRVRVALVTTWLVLLVAFAVLLRPLPVQPYPGG